MGNRNNKSLWMCALSMVMFACGACDSSSSNSSQDGGGSADLSAAPADLANAPPGATCKGTPFANTFTSDPRLCVVQFASGLGRARQLAFAPNGDLFVASDSNIVGLYDGDGDGVSGGGERFTFGSAPGLNHAVTFSPDRQWVYASSATTVYRWRYTAPRTPATGQPETVIRNIPNGGHVTRTLLFDAQGRLLVSVGSEGNLDTDAALLDLRAQIRGFNVSGTLPIEYATGTKVATGMRNEAGLTIDSQGVLWGVENGRDNIMMNGAPVVNDNPAEEINRIPVDGKFYGYPYCWSEGNLTGGAGAGTQHFDEQVPQATRKDNAWCRNPANVVPPTGNLQGHWAPLGITEYTGSALPYRGDLIVAAHGSWNRTPATGRVIARARRGAGGTTVTGIEIIVGESNGGQLRQGEWSVRPVDVRQGPDQAIYFSDDAGGRVFRIGYRP